VLSIPRTSERQPTRGQKGDLMNQIAEIKKAGIPLGLALERFLTQQGYRVYQQRAPSVPPRGLGSLWIMFRLNDNMMPPAELTNLHMRP
jgi:hypothetical protein